jgi:pimeloyl-ACP methyl ester carboxylesterase
MTETVPLYLLPGLICDETIWAAQVSALSELTEVAVPDYGDARSLEAMAECVLASAPVKISLAGHSMGGRVALEVCRIAPDRVERLAMLDTGVHPLEPGETEKRLALLDLGRREGMEALVESWLLPIVHPDYRSDDVLMTRLRNMCVSAGIERFENQITALINRSDARPLLGEISCPTLVATGREDLWSPVAQHEEIAKEIRGSEMLVFENAGHMAPAETPEDVTEALRRWLTNQFL